MWEKIKETELTTTPVKLFRPICWLKTLLRSFPWLHEWRSGHNYAIEVPFTKVDLEVLICEDCGHRSFAWVALPDDRTMEERYKE